VVKYYALLAIVFLAANPELQLKVERSGTLELVVPYIQSQDPEELPKKCQNHLHGRSASWLRRLVPLLLCDNDEARLLSAFHFAMEVGVKKKQQRLKVRTGSRSQLVELGGEGKLVGEDDVLDTSRMGERLSVILNYI